MIVATPRGWIADFASSAMHRNVAEAARLVLTGF
jgi:hypothetical protein